MIECSTFPHIAEKYMVQGVPKIVINETHEIEGLHPIEFLLDEIEKI